MCECVFDLLVQRTSRIFIVRKLKKKLQIVNLDLMETKSLITLETYLIVAQIALLIKMIKPHKVYEPDMNTQPYFFLICKEH